jgi:hypothetical protein
MRHKGLLTLIFVPTFFGCGQKTESKTFLNDKIEQSNLIVNSRDTEEIQNLIRRVLNWAESKTSINLLPAISEGTDSVYTGFDFKMVEANLIRLKQTGLFAREFIDNYNQMMLTLDKKIKAREYTDWLIGEIQSFNFANDVDPWCYCQETPSDNPNPWNMVKVTIIKLDEGKAQGTWTWGQTNWSDIAYSFRAVKEDGRWKISYMKGFDYNDGIIGE